MKRVLAFVFFMCSLQLVTLAQPGRDETLANSYLQNNEFDKAAELFQGLWEKNNYDPKYYTPLYNCLVSLKKFDELEKVVKKQIKKNEGVAQYVVDLGFMFAQVPDAAKAKEQYERAVKELRPNDLAIRSLAGAFENYRLYDYVIATYEKGNKIFKNDATYSMQLAGAYMSKQDAASAVKYFLISMDANPFGV